ncbi:hypothetical protein MSAN_02061000 [Mycena sanguinolenta]|uniref:Uncharacterized protein n=1 Tax=Mycena sanguinolenta TaxID=230812 RepID=A0A8H6XI42_9AGAR|nr:hypothetical protein MSAN_02061000 [Mycena sanguinolenta]
MPIAFQILVFAIRCYGNTTRLWGTALLAITAFDVPTFQQVYLVRFELINGTVSNNTSTNQTGPSVDFGVLGFCTDLQNGQGVKCSPARIGYNLSEAIAFLAINLTTSATNASNFTAQTTAFLATNLTANTTNAANVTALTDALTAVTSGLTTVLVLHIVAFVIALTAFALVIMGFSRRFAMADKFSLCLCGLAGAAAFAAFFIDLAFFASLKRVENIGDAGAVIMGPGVYLTLLAFFLLITPILLLLGRYCGCCRSKKSRKRGKGNGNGGGTGETGFIVSSNVTIMGAV